ncbi:MAG: hypothetical protein ACRD4K_10090, partial [Candidatus Acidiferrales bacterium]
QLMRAQTESKTFPAMPELKPADQVNNASEYAGRYLGADGRKIDLVAQGEKLFLVENGARAPLERHGEDSFLVHHKDWERYSLVFRRADESDPKSVVVEAGWGSLWFANAQYKGPKAFEYPKEWNSYDGHYRNENPWIGSLHVVIRKGKLMIDGETPLEPGEGGVFYLRDEEHSPEWIQFGDIVNGKAMKLKLSGEDLWRVETA